MNETLYTDAIGWLIPLKWCCVGLGTIVLVWVAGKWVKNSSRKQDKLHHEEIVNDILDAFRLSDSGQKTVAALDAAISCGSGGLPNELSSIFRIECVYESVGEGFSLYNRKVLVYFTTNKDEEKMITIKREYKWAYLPSAVRTAFIHDKSKRVIELLYDGREISK